MVLCQDERIATERPARGLGLRPHELSRASVESALTISVRTRLRASRIHWSRLGSAEKKDSAGRSGISAAMLLIGVKGARGRCVGLVALFFLVLTAPLRLKVREIP